MSEMTSELAVHMAAAAYQANAAALVDSAAFMSSVEQLRPDTPGFVSRVSEAVRRAVEQDRERYGTGQAPVERTEPEPPRMLSRDELLAQVAARRAELTADYAGEITEQDVKLADPAVVNAWATSGRLAHFGIAAKQRRAR